MNRRAMSLIASAVLLVAGVIGVQVANGGGTFEPTRPANPCHARRVTPVATGIDALGERLVLLGLDGAACRLHVTREAFVLGIASSDRPTDDQVQALRAGLLDAVTRMKTEGTLPKASSLVDEALADADLNSFVKFAIRALPDALIDAALKTDDVLRRTINGLDVRQVLADIDDPAALNRQIQSAVQRAVKDSLIARLRDLLP